MKQNGKQFVAGFLCGAIIFGDLECYTNGKLNCTVAGWINGIWI